MLAKHMSSAFDDTCINFTPLCTFHFVADHCSYLSFTTHSWLSFMTLCYCSCVIALPVLFGYYSACPPLVRFFRRLTIQEWIRNSLRKMDFTPSSHRQVRIRFLRVGGLPLQDWCQGWHWHLCMTDHFNRRLTEVQLRVSDSVTVSVILRRTPQREMSLLSVKLQWFSESSPRIR